jgi:hypothetical protein
MWFQTILLATLSLTGYVKHSLAFLGRCNRSCRRPSVVHVRCNSIAGLWLAAMLAKNSNHSTQVVVVEEEDDAAPTTAPIQDDEVPLLDAALEAVGVSIAAWVDPPPDDAAENASANEWTVFASIKQRTTTSTGSHGKIPEGGWEGVRDRLRNELVHEDAVPGHALLHYVDVREEEPDQKVDLDLDLAFSLLGFMHLERTMLGVTFILDEMAAARARERNALIAEVVEEIVEDAVEDAAAAKDKTV